MTNVVVANSRKNRGTVVVERSFVKTNTQTAAVVASRKNQIPVPALPIREELNLVVADARYLRYDTAQGITQLQQEQARNNIGFTAAVTAQVDVAANIAYRNVGHIPTSEKGAANGVVTTDVDNRILNDRLPLLPSFNQVSVSTQATENHHVVRLDQLNSVILGQHWQPPVHDILSTTPVNPNINNRYIVGSNATGAWAGQENNIATWNGTVWEFSTPVEGWTVWVRDVDTNYNYNGTAWVEFGTTVTHNNQMGLQGGQLNQYYHLTQEQHTLIVNVGDNVIYHAGNANLSTVNWATANLSVAGQFSISSTDPIVQLIDINNTENEWNIISSAGQFSVRENGTSNTRLRIDDGGLVNCLNGLSVTGTTNSTSYSVGGVAGVSGIFTTTDNKTITITNGIVISIV